jgi:hypothetical protein
MSIIREIREFIKNIKYFTATEKLDIDDIEPMRYPKGREHEWENFVNPFTKYNSHNSRIQYRRRR